MSNDAKKRSLSGAAAITHNLKVFGDGRMQDGLKRLEDEARQQGIQQGYLWGKLEQLMGFFTSRR